MRVFIGFKIGLLPSATENIAVPSTTSFTVSSSVTPASTSSSRTTRNSLRSSNNNSKKRKEKEPSPCPSFDSTPNVEVSMDGYGNDDNEDDDYSSSQPMGTQYNERIRSCTMYYVLSFANRQYDIF